MNSLQLEYPRTGNMDINTFNKYFIKLWFCRNQAINLFKAQMQLFFQQFLTRVIFAEVTTLPEDLLRELIAFSLSKQPPRDIYLKLLHTPQLRCIILELIFQKGLEIIKAETNIRNVTNELFLNERTFEYSFV